MKKLFFFRHPYLIIVVYLGPMFIAGAIWGVFGAVVAGHIAIALIAAYAVTMKKYV